MKASEQPLHDESGQPQAWEEVDSHKLDDIGMVEGAHQLQFFRELSCDFGTVHQNVVDSLGSTTERYGHLLDAAVGSASYYSTCELKVGQDIRPQARMGVKKTVCHHFTLLTLGARACAAGVR